MTLGKGEWLEVSIHEKAFANNDSKEKEKIGNDCYYGLKAAIENLQLQGTMHVESVNETIRIVKGPAAIGTTPKNSKVDTSGGDTTQDE